MKWIFILSILLAGCNNMATTAEETTPTPVSTNVVDDTDVYDSGVDGYKDNEEVIYANNIYYFSGISKLNTNFMEYASGDRLIATDGFIYEANEDIPERSLPSVYEESFDCPTWEQLTTLNTPITVSGYTFESVYVGTSPHLSVALIIKDGSDTEISRYGLARNIEGNLLEYKNNGGILFSMNRSVFDNGKIYNIDKSNLYPIYLAPTDARFSKIEYEEYLTYRRPTLDKRPFDEMNTSYATIDDLMQYSISANADFNSFFLSGVTATSLNYTVTDGIDNTITETDTKTIDCKRDPDGLLPLGTVTIPVILSKVYPAGSTIDIELTNDGEVKLGHISTNMAIDEGMTEFTIGASAKDYNDYTPDSWGNIEEGVKAKTKQLSISVKAPYDEFDMTYSRHMSYLGKFIAIDPTEIGSNPNSLSLRSLVLRGLILSINAKTLVKDKQMLPYYQWDMTFLEIV